MIIDSIIIFSVIIAFCIAWAEYGNKQAFGIAGSLLMLVLGFWIYSDGIQIQTGQITTFSGLDNSTTSSNLTGLNLQLSNSTSDFVNLTSSNSTVQLNQSEASASSTRFGHTETVSKIYSDLPATPGVNINTLLGLILNLLGIGGLLYYSLQPWGAGSAKSSS